MKVLENLARVCAVLAGVLLTLITLMTCVSLIGRNTTGWTLVGDFELSGSAAGAAIALFLPWCQVHGANIIVDFFTQKVGPRKQAILDGIGAIAMAAMTALLGWRTAVGAVSIHEAGETSVILGLPTWWTYAMLAPGLALTCLVALVQAGLLFGGRDIKEMQA